MFSVIKEEIEKGNFYEAQYHFEHNISENITNGKIEDALLIILNGIKIMIKHEKENLAFDLGMYVVKALKDSPLEPESKLEKLKMTIFEYIETISNLFKRNGENKLKLCCNFADSLFKKKNPKGFPGIHSLCGNCYFVNEDFESALFHYEFATVNKKVQLEHLISLMKTFDSSKSENEKKTNREMETYIVLHILKKICTMIQNNSFLNEALAACSMIWTLLLENLGVDLKNKEKYLPILNFMRFILLSIEKNNYYLMKHVIESYQPLLDSSYWKTSLYKNLKLLCSLLFPNMPSILKNDQSQQSNGLFSMFSNLLGGLNK